MPEADWDRLREELAASADYVNVSIPRDPPLHLFGIAVHIMTNLAQGARIIVSDEPMEHERVSDNATEELLASARTGDRAAFDALAACLLPAQESAECWDGARRRLGLTP